MPKATDRSQSETTSVSGITSISEIASTESTVNLLQQELADLAARVTALERITQIEERLTRLENRKRTSEAIDDLIDQSQPKQDHFSGSSADYQASLMRSTIEEDTDSSDTATYRPTKRSCYGRGIKVTPSYILRTSSSLRE